MILTMGFGILLIGYLLLIPIPFFGGIDLHPFAYGIMFSALLRLLPYEESFRYPKWVTLPLLPVSTAVMFLYILKAFGISLFANAGSVLAALETAKRLLAFLFQLSLLLAMRRLCIAVERKDLGWKCLRNTILVGVYFALMLALNLPLQAITDFKAQNPQLILIFDALWILLLLFCALRIWGCYQWICPEGEEDLPPKEGKFDRYLRRRREEKDALREEYRKSRKKK